MWIIVAEHCKKQTNKKLYLFAVATQSSIILSNGMVFMTFKTGL